MTSKPHILAEITLFKTSEGGRLNPTPPNSYRCPALIKDEYHDIRFDLSLHGSISPGDSAVVPASFLDPASVVSKLTVGISFLLWETRAIGKAKVNEIYKDT
jgi:hypothetical protein